MIKLLTTIVCVFILAGCSSINSIHTQTGRTSLMNAVLKNNVKTVHRLLQKGADPNIQDNKGRTALVLASLMPEENTEIIKSLINYGADPNIRENENLGTALMYATGKGKIEVVKVLISAGADVNISASGGMTPLMVAAMANHNDLLTLLSRVANNLDAQNKEGQTALFFAIQESSQLVETLITAGANVNISDNAGNTALLVAVETNLAAVPLLIKAGANVNQKNKKGMSPILLSTLLVSLDETVIKNLLTAGANPNISVQNLDGSEKNINITPFSAIIGKSGHYNLLKMLLKARNKYKNKIDLTSAIIEAIREEEYEDVKILIAYGAPVNPRLGEQFSLLSLAEEVSSSKIVSLLRQKGAHKTFCENNIQECLNICKRAYRILRQELLSNEVYAVYFSDNLYPEDVKQRAREDWAKYNCKAMRL